VCGRVRTDLCGVNVCSLWESSSRFVGCEFVLSVGYVGVFVGSECVSCLGQFGVGFGGESLCCVEEFGAGLG